VYVRYHSVFHKIVGTEVKSIVAQHRSNFAGSVLRKGFTTFVQPSSTKSQACIRISIYQSESEGKPHAHPNLFPADILRNGALFQSAVR
jgi:hypothetical protein